MRPELEDIQLLESYLQGTLTEEQELDMEVRLLWNKEWQENLAAQQLSYQAIQQAGRKQLRAELNRIHHRLLGA